MAQQNEISVTPTITAALYAAGNQIGGLMTLSGVNSAGSEGCSLQKITVIDKSGQSSAVDVLLFSALPTVGSDKANVNISNADMTTKCIGNAKILATAYSAITGATASVATYSQPNLPLYCKPATAFNGGVGSTLYAVLVCRGTPTYVSTSDITVKFHFSWD